MYQYGFELEGFFRQIPGGDILIPPKEYPHDGFPGLCEVRSVGGSGIYDAYYQVLKDLMRNPFDMNTPEHTFTPAQKTELRRTRSFTKQVVDIRNVYGKSPRALGNRTLASFQINVSNQLSGEWTNNKGTKRPAAYGLFDVAGVVKRLDKEFTTEIALSKRQPGFYAIKDNIRLEYRSLPNFVFRLLPHEIKTLGERITRAVEGV